MQPLFTLQKLQWADYTRDERTVDASACGYNLQNILDLRTDNGSIVHEQLRTWTDADPIGTDYIFISTRQRTKCMLFQSINQSINQLVYLYGS